MTLLSCAVCLDSEEKDGGWAALGCGHVYHVSCIGNWFSRKKNCPTCKADSAKALQAFDRRQPLVRLYCDAPEQGAGGDDAQTEEQQQQEETGPSDWAASAAAAHLKQQLLKESKQLRNALQRVQQHESTIQEQEQEVDAVKAQRDAEQSSRREAEARMNTKIGECNALAKENKALSCKAKHLETLLSKTKRAAQRAELSDNWRLVGEHLRRALVDLEAAGGAAPEYFRALLEARNAQLTDATSAAQRAQRDLHVAQAELNQQRQRADALAAAAAAAAAAQNGAAPPRQDWAPPPPIVRPVVFRSGVANTLARQAERAAAAAAAAAAPVMAPRSRPPARAPLRPVEAQQQQAQAQEEDEEDDLVELDGSQEDPELELDVGGYSEVESDGELEPELEPGAAAAAAALGARAVAGRLRSPAAADDASLVGASDPAFRAAGPSRAANQAAPGASFMRHPELATTGLDGRAAMIQRGPDGRGGVATAYRSSSGGGGARAHGAWAALPAAKKARKGGKAAAPGGDISNYFRPSAH